MSSAEHSGPAPGVGTERIVAAFAAALRASGVSVPTGSVVVFTEALALVGLSEARFVYWAGRATLLRSREDVAAYDRVFDSFWRGRSSWAAGDPPATPATLALDEGGEDPPDGSDEAAGAQDEGEVRSLRYSSFEVLERRDIARLSAAEWEEARRLISLMRISPDLRTSRRTRSSRRAHRGAPDLRATVRASLASGGVPVRRAYREAVRRPRRMVLLLDVSGSMEPYSRALARFAHAAVGAGRIGSVEVFTFGTRLTRVTREMARCDPESALAAVSGVVADWSGGTRLGSGLRSFNDSWGVRGTARGATVVVCSDGWDRGDPQLVASEMARLSRVARRVVWVNPLKATPGYAPLARGMAAALPFVDHFVEGHSVESLERLAEVVAGCAGGRGARPVR